MKKTKMTAGFTLVELIVVIAILGILAGVGTVGYSGYIKKANMAADEQLVAGIKNTLTLASYSLDNALGDGGHVVLTTEGVSYKDANGSDVADEETSPIYQTIIAAFGSDDGMKLAYGEWDSTGMADVVANYSGSSFEGNEAALVSDVQKLTNAVNSMMGTLDANDLGALMGGSFGTYMKDTHGIDIESASLTDADKQKIANSAALFVAQQMNAKEEDGSYKVSRSDLETAWRTNTFTITSTDPKQIALQMKNTYSGTGLSTVGQMAAYYANVEAMVQYVNKEYAGNKPEKLAEFNAAFAALDFAGVADAVNDRESGVDANTAATNAVFEAMATTYLQMAAAVQQDGELGRLVSGYGTAAGEKDSSAYASALEAVDKSSDKLAENLGSSNLYGDGTAEDLLLGYLGAGAALNGAPDNSVVVSAVKKANGSYAVTALPMDAQ